MFKFLVKVVVVVLAIQSGLGYLRKEGLISGEIKVNYHAVKEKILKIIPTDKIADKLQDVVTSKIKEVLSSKVDNWQTELSQNVSQGTMGERQSRVIVHIVSEGETLADLSQMYNVPWQVIKKINQIGDGRELTTGRQIRIPSIPRNIA